MPKIQFKRGIEAKLPTLSEGEPGFTTDTKKLFIGGSDGNVQFAKQADVDAHTVTLGTKANQSDLDTTNANVASNTTQLADIMTNKLPAKADKTYVDTQVTAQSKKKFVLYVSSTKLYVGMRFNATQDIRYEFTNQNVNGIWQFSRLYLFNNTNPYPSNDFSSIGTRKLNGGTDVISPYMMMAVNNPTGDWAAVSTSNLRFTGGFHGYDGGNEGEMVPNPTLATGKNYICDIFYDSNKTNPNTAGTYYADNILIRVKNKIQTCNTMLSTGGGREVLEENVEYRFKNACEMNIDIFIQASENLNINTWYGVMMPMDRATGAASQCIISGQGSNTKIPTINASTGQYLTLKPARYEFLSQDRTFKFIQEIAPTSVNGTYVSVDADKAFVNWQTTNKIYHSVIARDTGTFYALNQYEGLNFNSVIRTLPY